MCRKVRPMQVLMLIRIDHMAVRAPQNHAPTSENPNEHFGAEIRSRSRASFTVGVFRRLTHRAGSAAAPSLGAMVMGEPSGIETALIFLVGLSGLAILLAVLFSGWIERFADLMAQRSERRREKVRTKPTLDG
jgi:hypothetical protein